MSKKAWKYSLCLILAIILVLQEEILIVKVSYYMLILKSIPMAESAFWKVILFYYWFFINLIMYIERNLRFKLKFTLKDIVIKQLHLVLWNTKCILASSKAFYNQLFCVIYYHQFIPMDPLKKKIYTNGEISDIGSWVVRFDIEARCQKLLEWFLLDSWAFDAECLIRYLFGKKNGTRNSTNDYAVIYKLFKLSEFV